MADGNDTLASETSTGTDLKGKTQDRSARNRNLFGRQKTMGRTCSPLPVHTEVELRKGSSKWHATNVKEKNYGKPASQVGVESRVASQSRKRFSESRPLNLLRLAHRTSMAAHDSSLQDGSEFFTFFWPATSELSERFLGRGGQTPNPPLVACSFQRLRVHLGKICVAVLRNKSRAAHWSPPVHCTMKMATMPVLGLTDKSVP